MKKAQSSMEYLMITGLALIAIMLVIGISSIYSRNVVDTITKNQIDRTVRELIDTAEIVYYEGQPSKQTIRAVIPDKVESIEISNGEISFKIRTQSGITDIAYSSKVNLSGSISNSPGYRNILVEAKEDYVWINGTV